MANKPLSHSLGLQCDVGKAKMTDNTSLIALRLHTSSDFNLFCFIKLLLIKKYEMGS